MINRSAKTAASKPRSWSALACVGCAPNANHKKAGGDQQMSVEATKKLRRARRNHASELVFLESYVRMTIFILDDLALTGEFMDGRRKAYQDVLAQIEKQKNGGAK